LTPGLARGAALLALVDALDAQRRAGALPLDTRALHLLWALSLAVAVGLLVDLGAAGLRRGLSGRPGLRWALAWTLAVVAGYGLLARNLAQQGEALAPGAGGVVVTVGLHAAAGAALVAAGALGAFLATRTRAVWQFAPVPLALIGHAANVSLLSDDYFEVHAAVALGTALFAGPTLARLGDPLTRRGRVALGGLAVGLALLPPPDAVRRLLFGSPAVVAPWVAAASFWRVPTFDAAPAVDPRAPLPPREVAPVAPPPPVVVLVTIDAVRADAVDAPADRVALPAFERLYREGAAFTHARSPGSQTAVSLATLFSGRSFSALRWAPYGAGTTRFLYPAADPSPRLATLLSDAGVFTSKVAALTFLGNDFGVAPGFADEQVVATGRAQAPAAKVVPPLLTRLRAAPTDRPAFYFVHLTEPHAPYDRGRLKIGPAHDRYLSEIAEADRWLEQILQTLTTPALRGRALLIVTADHGEAFGEHGTTEHSKTLYEELVRVPLLFWGRGVTPRSIDAAAGLLDLAPTILETFGRPPTAEMRGQSLWPWLRGEPAHFTRPLIAEGRQRRALWVGDRKVVVDHRRRIVEAYDLAADPGELHDLSADAAFTAPLGAALREDFAAHAVAPERPMLYRN
jgi:arylsulfatase A-like enzyme